METPLDATNIGNVDFTFSMILDNMVSVVGTIIRLMQACPTIPFASSTCRRRTASRTGAHPEHRLGVQADRRHVRLRT